MPVNPVQSGAVVASCENMAKRRTYSVVVSILLVGLSSVNFAENAETKIEEEEKREGHSVAPVVGYEPTYGFVAGGAYFYESQPFSFRTDFNLNFKQVYQFHMHVAHRIFENWQYEIHSRVMKGFDPYYGEGGETNPNNFSRIWGSKSVSRVQLTRRLNSIFSLGLFGDFRTRTEEVNPKEPLPRRYPNETTGGAGISFKIDSRRFGGREGFLFITDAEFIPKTFTTLTTQNEFGQVEGTFIIYKRILDEVVDDVIAAFRLMGGVTFGEPSYMFKFRLGGSDGLPGYHDDRFRGKFYYAQQTELRFPIWKLFSGAAFLGFGDATNTNFTNAKMAYGGGLRIGLPPDWVSKLRIDVAFGRDEQGIFANFGESF